MIGRAKWHDPRKIEPRIIGKEREEEEAQKRIQRERINAQVWFGIKQLKLRVTEF